MNTYIINYLHNGKEEDAYIYADSFEEAELKFKSLRRSGNVRWELVDRIPVKDEDAIPYIDSMGFAITAIKKAQGGLHD